MRILASLGLMVSLLSPLPVCALEFLPARDLGRTYGFTIAIKKKQRVVVVRNNIPATGVLAVVKTPFDNGARLIRELAWSRYGGIDWHEQGRSDQDYWERAYGRIFPDPERGARQRDLKAASVVVEKYREITYRSAHYNILKVLGWIRGYSELRMWVLDGHDVFAMPSTILRLRREDEVYAWGFAGHMPIPSFHLQGADFISEDELGLVHDLARGAAAPFAYYAERNFSDSLLDSTPMLIQAARWLRSQP